MAEKRAHLPRVYAFEIGQADQRSELRPTHSFPIMSHPGNGPPTGLAWDGANFWIATGAGLCACVLQVNPDDGRVLSSFFPHCEPTGLAFDEGTKALYVTAKGPSGQPVIMLERALDPTAFVDGRLRRAPKLVRVFRLPAEARPEALAGAPSTLWFLDQRKGLQRAVIPVRAREVTP